MELSALWIWATVLGPKEEALPVAAGAVLIKCGCCRLHTIDDAEDAECHNHCEQKDRNFTFR